LALTDKFTANVQVPRSVHFPVGSLIGANRDGAPPHDLDSPSQGCRYLFCGK
jgi:hypothetical protein